MIRSVGWFTSIGRGRAAWWLAATTGLASVGMLTCVLAAESVHYESAYDLTVSAVLAEDDGTADDTCLAGPVVSLGNAGPDGKTVAVPECEVWFVTPSDKLSPRPAQLKTFVAELKDKNVRGVSFRELPDFSDATLRPFTAAAGLEYIDVHSTRVTPSGLASLRKLKRLRFLDAGDLLLGNADFAKGMKKLEAIDVSSMPLVNAQLATLAGLPKLHTIVARDAVTADASALRALQKSKRLRVLDIGHNPDVTSAHLAPLERVFGLERLIVDATGVDDGAFATLGTMKALSHLDVSRCARVRGSGLSALSRSPVRSLILRETGVGDSAMAAIGKIGALTLLDLSETSVTDASLSQLSRLRALRELRLVDCPGITDAGLPALHELTSLRVLELAGTKVTASGARKLAKVLDACDVRRF